MMIFASFKDLHSIHNLCLHGIHNPCLHGRIIHKNCFCLHDTPGKRAVVYTISRPIFCILHIIIQDGFSGLSGLKGEFQGLYLWYIVKESQNLLLKTKITRKPLWSPLRFNFLQVTPFSLSNSCLTDQTAQREFENHKIQFFLSMLASMTGHWV